MYASNVLSGTMSRLAAAFDRLVSAATRSIATCNATIAYCVIFMVGFFAILSSGIYQDTVEIRMLHHHGLAALLAYHQQLASHRLPLEQFMLESVVGHGYAAGSTILGVGLWLTLVVAPLVACVICLARIEVRMTQRTRIKQRLDEVLARV